MGKRFLVLSAATLLISGVAFGGDATLPDNIAVSANGSRLAQPAFQTVAAEAPAVQQSAGPVNGSTPLIIKSNGHERSFKRVEEKSAASDNIGVPRYVVDDGKKTIQIYEQSTDVRQQATAPISAVNVPAQTLPASPQSQSSVTQSGPQVPDGGMPVPAITPRPQDTVRKVIVLTESEDTKASATEAPPMGQPAGGTPGISGDVTEKKSNIVHPFLAVGGYFTDNVNNSHDNKKSDMGFIVSPGVYFTVPGMRQRITPTGTLNIAPGGANSTEFRPDYPLNIRSYLYYRADIETFANAHELDDVSHLVEGVVQYKMRGGLQFDLSDQFNLTHNPRGTGFSNGLDRYYGNLLSLSTKYQLGEKSLVRLDLSDYYLSFLKPENSFRDRNDSRAAVYYFHKFWPKTSLFVEYEFMNIAYKEQIVSNSMEHHLFAGIRWDVTDKTRGMLKAGYGIKEFKNSNIGNSSNLYAEAQLDHKFTPKTSILFSAVRRTDETDVAPASSIVETSGEITLLHRLTTKLTGNINFRFTDELYKGEVTLNGETKRMHDQYLRAGTSLLYEFRDWLSFTLGYYFTDRMSNFNSLSYKNNTIFFRISAIY